MRRSTEGGAGCERGTLRGATAGCCLACLVSCGRIIGIDEVSRRGDGSISTDVDAGDEGVSDTAPEVPPPAECETIGTLGDSYADTVMADLPVGYWPLEDAMGSKMAQDVSGSAHHATVLGSVVFREPGAFATGVNFAARLDGLSALKVGKTFDFGKASFTIEAWVRPLTLDAGFRYVFGKDGERPGSTPPVRQGYQLYIRSVDVNFIRYTNGIPSGNAAGEPLVAKEWTHVVARYDADTGTSSLFLDGERVARNANFGPDSDTTSTAGFAWGNTDKLWATAFDGGSLDELAVYDKALPCARVKAHYAAAKRTP